MSFVVLGLNHRTAPLDLRERLAIERDQLIPSLQRLLKYVEQGVVLSTCNRLEIYSFNGSSTALIQQARKFLVAYSGVADRYLDPHLYQHQGGDCVGHLFRVAGGLDSMVVGETQILGQVRAAYSAASEQGCVGGTLSRLFHQALRVGRRIQRDTNIGDNARSVSRAGVQLVSRVRGDLHQHRVLVIGAGDTGRLVAHALSDAGVKNILVANRTPWRATELAQKLGGVAVPFDELPHQLAYTDVVISSTGSPGYVLDRAAVQEAMLLRKGRPLILLDIAVPRDIDPSVGDLDQVLLYNIDSLQLVSEGGVTSLDQELARAEAIVGEETEEFLKWCYSLEVAPLITAMREQAEEIRRVEVDRTLQKLKGQGSQDIAPYLDAMTGALVKKLLHHPTVYLRERGDAARQQLVRELFNLDGEGRG